MTEYTERGLLYMAERVYFVLKNNHVVTKTAIFEWFSGFSVTQKQKSIASFHKSIEKAGFCPLEVSTKSTVALGQKLSAFNLQLNGNCLECIFQSSKVFQKGGPYEDILHMSPKEAKRDQRLKESGALCCFRYNGEDWELLPKTLFYDYIYYQAVRATLSEEELKELTQYNAFTDIEFNSTKSINTQARAIALVSLIYQERKYLPDLTKAEFLELHKKYV